MRAEKSPAEATLVSYRGGRDIPTASPLGSTLVLPLLWDRAEERLGTHSSVGKARSVSGKRAAAGGEREI